jgi:AAA domain
VVLRKRAQGGSARTVPASCRGHAQPAREARKEVPGCREGSLWSAVVLPYASLDFESEEWHPWQLIDSARYRSASLAASCTDVLDRAQRFLEGKQSARWFDPESAIPSEADCEEIARVLRPDFEAFQSPRARRRQTSAELKRYTEEQFAALDAMSLNPRVVFEGPAGAGKTVLAIESVQRAAAAGKRTLLVCFNRLLGSWLRRETESLGDQVVAGTLHSHMLAVAELAQASHDSPSFWDDELPLLALERLLDAEGRKPFDLLVVDEAQDLLDDRYLDIFNMSVAGGLSSGEWRMFGDFERQSIYGGGGTSLADFLAHRGAGTPVFSLRTNCRNRPRVATLVRVLSHLDPDYARVVRPDDGVEPELRFCADSSSSPEALVGVLSELRSDGYRGGDVVVLSPSASSCSAERVTEKPWGDRLRSMSQPDDGGHIRYGTIHAFKGMESAVVVATDLDDVSGAGAEALFYIAVTRPTERLILLLPESARASMARLLAGSAAAEESASA